MGSVKAFMPPQGILLIAALAPSHWEIRFIDENIRSATHNEMAWADVVFTTGMHIQRDRIRDIIVRAHRAGKPVVLGGPSVSSAPEWYPEADIIHCGEAGDATRQLFQLIDNGLERLQDQLILRTVERLPLSDMPMPAYHLIDVRKYLLCSIQFSSGCPLTCEYCDIPSLYGKKPRHKTPEQVVRELDYLAAHGAVSVYFVDDNFIGDPSSARELLKHLVAWQDKWDCQVRLACEATLSIAKFPDVLSQMRDAFFTNIFCGIETPQPETLVAIKKPVNLQRPILEVIDILNSYGMEVAAGLIMGFDTDTPETPEIISDFIRASQIPIHTVNILYALPKTRLYDRMKAANRIVSAEDRDSNIEFLQPYEDLVANWKGVIGEAFEPKALYKRYATQARKTYPNRRNPKHPIRQATPGNLARAASIFSRILWQVGIKSDYRGEFWSMFWTQFRQGRIENIFQIAMVAHHLINYSRDCVIGRTQASNYTHRDRPPPPRSHQFRDQSANLALKN
ncbi:MAG TPA: B12-binding domain-containing radical SAM protein [Verrucomicrobiae bacterium]